MYVPGRRRFKDVQIFDGERRQEHDLLSVSRLEGFDDRRQEEGPLDAEVHQVVVDGTETSKGNSIKVIYYFLSPVLVKGKTNL